MTPLFIESGSPLATAATAGLSAILSGGAVGWYVTLRKDRREETGSKVDVVSKLMTDVAGVQNRQLATWEKLEEVQGELTIARADATAARAEAHQVRRLFARLVRPLVEWIDRGATPPAPEVPHELRALLVDVVEHDRPAS